MDGVGAAKGVRGAFGEPEVFDLAFPVDKVSAFAKRAFGVEQRGREREMRSTDFLSSAIIWTVFSTGVTLSNR